MADTVDTAASSSPADEAEKPQDPARDDEAEERRPEEEPEEQDDARSVTELLEQLGHDLSELSVSEAQLEAARNMPEVRRLVRDIVGALVVVVAALTGFALLNVAAVDGLSRVLDTWLAALVLAAVWIAVGAVLLFGLMGRARRWLFWIVLKAPPTTALEELERERDDAIKAARDTLEHLGPALAIQISLAAVSKTGEIAGDAASGFVDVGDSALEASDEIVEEFAEELPGGSVVNEVWDIALMPGRFGVSVARTALRRRRPED